MQFHQLRTSPDAEAVLAARARALARRDEAQAGEGGDAVLTFLLGGTRYALPAAAVREVQPLGSYTTLPAVPPFVLGLVNVRGRLVAALDLRPLLGLPPSPPSPAAQLLIVGQDDASVGILADQVAAVHQAGGHLSPTPASATGQGLAWVRGVDPELTVHIDAATLLGDPRLIVDQEIEAQEK